MNKLATAARMALLLGLVFGPARLASASAFHVAPIRVDFNRSTTSTLLTLTNESTDELRFQISVAQWAQDAKGDMQLTPTEDIMFFPSLLTLKAKEERKVRVATTIKPGAVEKTYRIFFEELPPLEKRQPEGAASQVRIVTKLGVPIFIEPDTKSASGEVAGFSAAGGKIGFDVKNVGNVHFLAQKVRLLGVDGAGKSVIEKERDGWYILANTLRHYEVDLTPAECAKLKSVRVEVETDLSAKLEQSVLKSSFVVPESSCTTVSK